MLQTYRAAKQAWFPLSSQIIQGLGLYALRMMSIVGSEVWVCTG